MKNISSRSWGVILPAEWANIEQILELVRSYSSKYYYILHDSDVDMETGELKKAHYHVIMTFKTPRKLGTVSNYFINFKELQLNSFEKIRNIDGAKRYLIHLDDADKYQYDSSNIVSNDKNLIDQLAINQSKCEASMEIANALFNPPKTYEEFYEIHKPMLAKMNSYQVVNITYRMVDAWKEILRQTPHTHTEAPPTPAPTIVRGEGEGV